MEEILGTNAFIFFEILGGMNSHIAEESLRLLKISDNKLLLKNETTKHKYQELYKQHTRILENSFRNCHTKTDLKGLMALKAALGGGK